MKCIELKQFEPTIGMEYSVTTYPGPGAYLTSSGQIYVVNNGCVYGLPSASNLVRDMKDPIGTEDAVGGVVS